jgi:ribosome-binding factor A
MSNRRYARTARLNELLREILADELERLDDERLELVTVTGVEVDAGLDHAVVYYSALLAGDDDETQALIHEAFDDARARLQAAIARQARIRSTPRLRFEPDAGVRTGARVEEILRDLHTSGQLAEADDPGEGSDTR